MLVLQSDILDALFGAFAFGFGLPFDSVVALQNGHVKCLYSNISEMATNTK